MTGVCVSYKIQVMTMKQKEKQMDNKAKIRIMSIGLGVSICSIVFFAGYLIWQQYTMKQGQAVYASLSVGVVPRQAQLSPISYIAEEEFIPFIDFDEIRELFPSAVAWIQSEGTAINYPVVQGSDNDFYLHHLSDGTPNAMGSIFLDYKDSADFTNFPMIIYGHDMRTGQMFGSLRHYASQEFFEAHSSMFIFTPHANYEFVLVAGYVLDSSVEVPPMNFSGPDDFYEYMEYATSQSIFSSDVQIDYDDRMVYLATCTPTGSANERLILVGKLVNVQM
jgi:sortase B